MCAIIGLAAEKQGFNVKLMRLFNESKIRGLHAFGVTFVHDDHLRTLKTTSTMKMKSILAEIETTKLLLHCRYSTSGDYKDMENNQPIQGTDSALVFNGVISMATKEENEKTFGEKYRTDNDGEIILRMIEKGQPVLQFLKETGSFAGGFITPKSLIMFRNESRPMYSCKDEHGTWYASTKDIFSRAGFFKPTECEAMRFYEHQ